MRSAAPILGFALLASFLNAAPAYALLETVFVQRNGDTSASCGASSSPCGNLQSAHNATTAGGQIIIIDSGQFGALTATKSITVLADQAYAVVGSVSVAEPGIVVHVKNLIFDGGLSFQYGASISQGASLIVEDCLFHNFTQSGGTGIRFEPSSPSKLVVINSRFINNGGNGGGGGIVVKPFSGGSAQVSIQNSKISNNIFGVAIDGSASTAGVNMTVSDSDIANNSQDGLVATTPGGGAPIGVMVKNTRSLNNAFGLRSIGPNVTVRADNATVIGNGTGLSFSSGGALLTFGNNNVTANGTNGGFSGSVGLQ